MHYVVDRCPLVECEGSAYEPSVHIVIISISNVLLHYERRL